MQNTVSRPALGISLLRKVRAVYLYFQLKNKKQVNLVGFLLYYSPFYNGDTKQKTVSSMWQSERERNHHNLLRKWIRSFRKKNNSVGLKLPHLNKQPEVSSMTAEKCTWNNGHELNFTKPHKQ